MEERKEILNKFYTEDCDEEQRLLTNHGKIEFITTLKYIEKYLNESDKILEVGAGTGRYSLYFADKGYDVTAIDYVQNNVDILKSKIKDNMNIKAMQGDALDLSCFPEDTFDITLVLGPLYHLYTDEDIDKAIKEAIRVTKKDGILAFAYLTNDSIMVDYVLLKNHLIDGYKKTFDENFRLVSVPQEIFRAFYINEFKEMMLKYNIEYLNNIATDGMAHHFREKIDSLTDKEFEVWLQYHLSTCEVENLQGYSNHMLYICKKK